MEQISKVIAIKNIVPDENQPRKYFDAQKMNLLQNSIKRHGVISPLVVEDMGNGKFLLVDGERRFRAATEIGLKEVPAVVEQPKNAVERLVRQFNVQEQHEGWTPLEKAIAIDKLAEEMGLSVDKTCELLGTTPSDRRRYVAFTGLADKSFYVKNEIPLDFAAHVRSLTNESRKLTVEKLEKPWNPSDTRRLEHKLVNLIRTGEIRNRADFMMVKASIEKNPALIEKFTERNITPTELFAEAKAKGSRALRNAFVSLKYGAGYGAQFLKIKDTALNEAQLKDLKWVRDIVTELIATAE